MCPVCIFFPFLVASSLTRAQKSRSWSFRPARLLLPRWHCNWINNKIKMYDDDNDTWISTPTSTRIFRFQFRIGLRLRLDTKSPAPSVCLSLNPHVRVRFAVRVIVSSFQHFSTRNGNVTIAGSWEPDPHFEFHWAWGVGIELGLRFGRVRSTPHMCVHREKYNPYFKI